MPQDVRDMIDSLKPKGEQKARKRSVESKVSKLSVGEKGDAVPRPSRTPSAKRRTPRDRKVSDESKNTTVTELLKKKTEVADEKPPPPTPTEVALTHCKKILKCAQRSEWQVCEDNIKALQLLTASGDIEKNMITHSADPGTGNTPLMFATMENRLSVMEQLVHQGCDINRKNKEEYTALHFGGNIFKTLMNSLSARLHFQAPCMRGKTP